MRSTAFAILMTLNLVLPGMAWAQNSCSGVFSDSRASYVRRLFENGRRQEAADPQQAQQTADFHRRILKLLFLDNNRFLRDTEYYGTMNLKRREVWIRISDSIPEFVEKRLAQVVGRDLGEPPGPNVNENVKTTYEIKTRWEETRDFLVATLAQTKASFDRAQKSSRKEDDAVNGYNERAFNRRYRNTPTVLGGIGTAVATGGALIYGVDPTLGAIAGPVAGLIGAGLTRVFYTDSPLYTSLRARYHKMRARSGTKAIALSIREMYAREHIGKRGEKQDADFAFEKAWEDWRLSVMQHESSRDKSQIERLTKRLNELTVLVETTGLWQLPNGERYADVAVAGGRLTDARAAALRAGILRKIDQLELMLEELQWIQNDLARIPTTVGGQVQLTAANQQMADGLRQSVASLRAVIEQRQDELGLIDQVMSMGPDAFAGFVKKVNAEGKLQ